MDRGEVELIKPRVDLSKKYIFNLTSSILT